MRRVASKHQQTAAAKHALHRRGTRPLPGAWARRCPSEQRLWPAWASSSPPCGWTRLHQSWYGHCSCSRGLTSAHATCACGGCHSAGCNGISKQVSLQLACGPPEVVCCLLQLLQCCQGPNTSWLHEALGCASSFIYRPLCRPSPAAETVWASTGGLVQQQPMHWAEVPRVWVDRWRCWSSGECCCISTTQFWA